MKNEEMKVTELLKEKQSIEGCITRLLTQLRSLKRELHESNNCSDCPTVEIYSSAKSFRSNIDSELLITAVERQIEMLQKQLDPIVKKLDAIELMLNS
jgi:predicted RNase H-like nuclease (RuvC/YqgF family)